MIPTPNRIYWLPFPGIWQLVFETDGGEVERLVPARPPEWVETG